MIPGGILIVIGRRASTENSICPLKVPARGEGALRQARPLSIGDLGSVRGFTVLELLVVLAVMVFLLAAMPQVFTAVRPGVRAQSAALLLASDLRQARNAAIMGNRGVRLDLDLTTGGYFVDAGRRQRHLPEGATLRFRGPRAEMNGNMAAIRFFPDGSSTGGEIGLSYEKQQRTVAVHWLDGRISVDERQGETR